MTMIRQTQKRTIDGADIVIVGNGIAGLSAAVEARRLEPDKSIVIMTNQSHPTINTPALKQFATGKLTREQLLAYPAGTERLQRIHVVTAYVEEIRSQQNYICLAGGRGFQYGSLLLATGSRSTGLERGLPGQDFDGVITLHRLQDYMDLRRRLNDVDEAVVVGGGFHAIETVMGLLYLGISVHWLIRSESFMARAMDQQASDMVLEGVRKAGAKIYTETEALGIVGRVGVVAGVMTTRQQMLPCQLVIVCTGTAPSLDLARHCDVSMKNRNGILVDDRMRTSVRNVYAAGDVAAIYDPQTNKYTTRPQWAMAVLEGQAAAAAMVGETTPIPFGVPWHATRLGDLSMLSVGDPLAVSDEITPLTQQRRGNYCRLALEGDRLVGYLSLGSTPADSLAIKRIIDEGLSVRDVTKSLLRGEFDAAGFFSGKRTYTVQRMITTGQLPTPLPVVPGLIAGQRRVATPAPGQTGSYSSFRSEQRVKKTNALKTEPLVRPTSNGQLEKNTTSMTEPLVRPTSGGELESSPVPAIDRRVKPAARPTWLDAYSTAESNRQNHEAALVHILEDEFDAAPDIHTPPTGIDSLQNPHPSRSIWHYTNKHAAVKGKGNVRK